MYMKKRIKELKLLLILRIGFNQINMDDAASLQNQEIRIKLNFLLEQWKIKKRN